MPILNIYIDEKGTQESFDISDPFDWHSKIKYGNDMMRNYMANIWMIDNDSMQLFDDELIQIEKRYNDKRQSSVDELKGEILLKGNFKNGIASMRKGSVDFYTELIKLCLKYKSNNMMYSVSKMNMLSSAKLSSWIYTLDSKRLIDNPYLLMYSITKYLDIEANEDVIQKLVKKEYSQFDLLSSIYKHMSRFIHDASHSNNRMTYQIEEYKSICSIIRKSKYLAEKTAYGETAKFNWGNVRFGIDLWCIENTHFNNVNPNDIICYLDQGINPNHFEGLHFQDIKSEQNSMLVSGIRVSDYIVALIGKLTSKLTLDTRYNPNKPSQYVNISDEFFDIKQDQFDLICLVFDYVFGDDNKYTYVVDTYSDSPEITRSFISYIASYDSYADFICIPNNKHSLNVINLYRSYTHQRWRASYGHIAVIRKTYGSYINAVNDGFMRPL